MASKRLGLLPQRGHREGQAPQIELNMLNGTHGVDIRDSELVGMKPAR